MSTDVNFDPETGEIREAPAGNASEYSVSEIAHALKRTIEDRFGFVRVRGEISGYRGPHSSGHCYFAIKDEGAKLDAVIWRGSFGRLRSKLQEGLEVIVSGKITSYPGKSSYQIIIENVEPAGVGALMALLEERKKKLAAEGLFDAARKRPIPYLPQVIGVVTSPTGAVIRDILHRLNDRFPRHVIVWPVRVQGETAGAEVAQAIQGFNAMAEKPDVLIVARGGGSLEDLWPFNDEAIVRAVAASSIPVISAIGHETDTTLIDFAADWRAPTPTAAAEKAVPVRAELVAETASLSARQKRAIARVMQERKLRLQSAGRALPKPDDMLAIARQRLDTASTRLPSGLRSNLQRHALVLARAAGRLSPKSLRDRLAEQRRRVGEVLARRKRGLDVLFARKRERFEGERKLLLSLSYKSVLARGFALVRDAAGRPLHAAAAVKPAARIEIEFADGRVNAVTEKTPGQGSLF
ncbi:MAG: exodeoxyribonuclease VII large subunit [Proteobacteria bacterium]|nr:exodeoxyribonuclease VII large subunit [Pseudomonadota bacterium]